MDAPSSTDIFLFDGFRLDRRIGALSRNDEHGVFAPVAVSSRALDILGVLVERQGELVSRAEIFSAVWPDTAVEDSNLNVQIAALRRVLDEGRVDGSCIQTIPGRGYRLAVPVTRVEASAAPASGRRPSNGAAGPIAEPKLPASSRSGNTPPTVAPRDGKWLWRGSLGLVAGAIGLLAAVLTAANLPSPRFASAHPAPRMSIVVLPFTNLGDDRDGPDLANGLTEDLTTELSQHSDIRVTSPYTAFAYRNNLVNTKQIGRELGVRYALEGSVQLSGNRLRVNTQLIDTEKDTQLWAAQFDRAADDLFALQNEIASQLGNTLGIELIAAEAAGMTDHPDAQGYILRGRAARLKPNSSDVYAAAIHLFEHALILDPQSIHAKAWLAKALVDRMLDGMADPSAADVARAEGLVDEVLAASPHYALAHLIKAQVLRAQSGCEEATPEYETALTLDHNLVGALHGLAWCEVYAGSLDKAIRLAQRAIRLSPLDPAIGGRYLVIGTAHLLQSRTDEAIVWFERARNVGAANPFVHGRLASAYALRGETDRAAAELAEARRLVSDDRYSSIARFRAAASWGVPKTRTLVEATYLAGLRKAGMPEE
jgi:adenylate cyclase